MSVIRGSCCISKSHVDECNMWLNSIKDISVSVHHYNAIRYRIVPIYIKTTKNHNIGRRINLLLNIIYYITHVASPTLLFTQESTGDTYGPMFWVAIVCIGISVILKAVTDGLKLGQKTMVYKEYLDSLSHEFWIYATRTDDYAVENYAVVSHEELFTKFYSNIENIITSNEKRLRHLAIGNRSATQTVKPLTQHKSTPLDPLPARPGTAESQFSTGQQSNV